MTLGLSPISELGCIFRRVKIPFKSVYRYTHNYSPNLAFSFSISLLSLATSFSDLVSLSLRDCCTISDLLFGVRIALTFCRSASFNENPFSRDKEILSGINPLVIALTLLLSLNSAWYLPVRTIPSSVALPIGQSATTLLNSNLFH